MEIEVVSGVIELVDNFTSEIGLAEAALHRFTKENQESLMAVAGVVGLVTAAFGAAAAAVYNLGQRGTNINDVAETFQNFSGTAAAAAANLDALRKGTKETIDDFTLMKDASHLLSAGVKLTSDDFSLLGEATLALQRRGLHGTVEMMDLVSDALINGRTKGIEAELGILNLDMAEQKYAKSLGVTVDQLTDQGKVQAKRIAIMDRMREVVASGTHDERNFAEQIEFAKTKLENFGNEVAQAIAKSPALAAGMQAISVAVSDAFGGDKSDLINTTLELIKSGAIIAVDFGLAMIEAARVVNVAWSSIKVVILGTETVLMGIAEAVAGTIAMVTAAAASLPGASSGMKQAAASAKEAADYIRSMTDSLAADTAEAAKGVAGTSEYDKTLDKLGGTLFQVRDAINGAKAAQEKTNETMDVAANNAKKLAAVQKSVSDAMIDRQKIEDELWKIEKKSIEETTLVWNEYYKLRVQNSGTSLDAQRATVNAWFDDEVSKLDGLDRNWQEHYDAIAAVAKEKLQAVEVDWASVRDKSIESLRQQAEVALRTYNEMLVGGQHFTREVLDEQLQKYHDLVDQARGMGKEFVAAQDQAREAAKKHKEEIEAIAEAARKAADELRRMGGAFEVTSQNFTKALHDISTAGGANPLGVYDEKRGFELARQGYSFQEILSILGSPGGGPVPPPRGPRIPGFAEGGTVDIMTGERGPEVMRVPLGTTVYPGGTKSGGGGDHIDIKIFVNGTAAEVARKVSDEIMKSLKSQRQFGAA